MNQPRLTGAECWFNVKLFFLAEEGSYFFFLAAAFFLAGAFLTAFFVAFIIV